jgi:hypothetical protein
MNIKRCGFDEHQWMVNDDKGEYVRYESHQEVVSALEAKCAALAAEREIVNADNAYLRDQIMCWARECDRITYTHTNKITDAHQSEAEQDLANTFPASSALLAEVRAQGVDAAIERLIQKFEGTGHIGVPVMVLESFAAQLRQGAAL